jgi:hypothetical protein
MKSVANPTDKSVAKSIGELQRAFKKMQLEQSKQIRLLQNEWKSQMKAITIQNNKTLEALNKIAKNSQNINALNEGKVLKKMNTSVELAKAVSKMNTDVKSEMNKYFSNLDLPSQVSSQIQKVFNDFNPSEAVTKALVDIDWTANYYKTLEKLEQERKKVLAGTVDNQQQYSDPEKTILKEKVEVPADAYEEEEELKDMDYGKKERN